MQSRMQTPARRWACLLLLVIAPFATADAWSERRDRARQERVEFLETLRSNQAERGAAAEQKLHAFLDQIQQAGWTPDASALWGLVAGVYGLDPDQVGDLPDRVRSVVSEQTDRPPSPAFLETLAAVRADLTLETYTLLQRAEAVGEVHVAVQLMRQVLLFDPDHQAIRRGLGQVRLSDELVDRLPEFDQPSGRFGGIPELAGYDPERQWFSRFDAQRIRQGLVWNPEAGWMPIRFADRYAQGYVFDLQRQQWDTLEQANDYHRQPRRDWVLRTEHLEIHGTAPLRALAQVATQLEAMYDEIFSVYARFFSDGQHDPLRLALGLVEHEPLVVWVYRDHAEYVQRADAVGWSGGIFRPSNGTSYFYGGPSDTMFHEFTHQVLHVMTGRNESPSWLTEAIAQFTETIEFSGDRVRFRGAAYQGRLPLPELLRLRGGAAWARHVQSDGASGYAEAGSLATFCMHADDGRFRADFIDFVRDCYRGQTRGKELWEYLGFAERDFIRAYHHWGQNQRR